VNKLVLLRRELHPMLSRLFKTVLMNLAKRSTDAFINYGVIAKFCDFIYALFLYLFIYKIPYF
jgi:hypothetical protein